MSIHSSISNGSGFLPLQQLNTIALGLNIEGPRPTQYLPNHCKWYNLIQVIDEPLIGITFDMIMKKVANHRFKFIEQAIDNFNIQKFITQLTNIINKIKGDHNKILVHVHQYTGTTQLHQELAKNTGLSVILDDTNFYEQPVRYNEKYSDIDALVSISQCAGFGLPAGSFIVPSSFMEFDVVNNIIYTNKLIVNNDIKKYLDFEFHEGNILFVNDLWSPDLKTVDGILLIDESDDQVLGFVKEHTREFDSSHDWKHAVKVSYNSTRILNNKSVLYLSLLHDVCDHKYSHSISRENLAKWIQSQLPEYQDINSMIDQVSYSYQKKHEEQNLKNRPNPVSPILEAVRDGDRLEAIGRIGIQRCEELVRCRNGKIPEDVVTHCYEKLLRLVPEKYIVSDIALPEAIKRHNEIVSYVVENLPKTTLKGYPVPEKIMETPLIKAIFCNYLWFNSTQFTSSH